MLAAHAASPVLEALRRPEAYPERPRRIEERHSHISWVFLVDGFVYKVKKPVRLTFVDYSTLERRRHFCHEEVRLNRRLAPRVYLGVAPIVRRDGRLIVAAVGAAPDGSVVEEYAVRMVRLPDERMLDRRLDREGPTAVPVAALARRLAEFHRLCPRGDGERIGSVEAVRRRVIDNLRETDDFVGDTLRRADRERIERAALAFIDDRRALLERRAALGFVREGHGDLRPEHVCLLPGEEIVVFDCVEFDERLRTGDVASELAFLTMEIDFLGFPELSEEIARAYAACAEDADLEGLLPFYAAHRAHVRGKVETLKSRDAELPAARRASARDGAERYFRLAARYGRGAPPPALIAVLGLSGSGKSTVARVASELSGFAVYSSDVVRKEIAAAERVRAEDLYSPALARRTYAALRERAARRLAAGRGAIVDSTLQDDAERRALAELAARAGVGLVFVECRAREDEIHRRLDARAARGDSVSDATWEVYLGQKKRFAPLAPMAGARQVTVDTTHGIDVETLERALFG